jgi:hypothetical protein
MTTNHIEMGRDITSETSEHIILQTCTVISNNLENVRPVGIYSCPQLGCSIIGLAGMGRLCPGVHSGTGGPATSSAAVPTEQKELMQFFIKAT